MTDITLSFEVHQPFRIRKDFFWNRRFNRRTENIFDHYFSTNNREIFEKVAKKCYLPANEIILANIDEFNGEKRKFKVSFSLSGVILEQCERYNPDVLESFRQLGETGCVEFLDQTYYHSLTSLYSDTGEFVEQTREHNHLMKDLMNFEPSIFENTEFIYNNKIAEIVESLGYKGIFTEGLERVTNNNSENYLYRAKGGNLKVLLRNYKLTDDMGFRFSSRNWEEYPLTAEKYSSWLANTPGDCINLFADYETFGEHHWEETGIFEFLRYLPREVLKWEHLSFKTPTEVVETHEPVDELDVFEIGNTISWADLERDTSCWIGNTFQWAAFTHHRDLLERVKSSPELYKIWRYLGISDHFYYMFSLGGGPGEVHSYFSPFDNPYNAFITYFTALLDFDVRVKAEMKQADDPFVFSIYQGKSLEKAWSLKEFYETLKKIDINSIRFHLERGDFQIWLEQSARRKDIAEDFEALGDGKELSAAKLRKIVIKILSKGMGHGKDDVKAGKSV